MSACPSMLSDADLHYTCMFLSLSFYFIVVLNRNLSSFNIGTVAMFVGKYRAIFRFPNSQFTQSRLAMQVAANLPSTSRHWDFV